MRLWQRQRVVYVMAAETFHRRDSLRRACCQIVCENKSEGKNESMRKKRARKKRKCAQLLSRTACAVSHYFSYSTENSKSRDTLIKMCTHTLTRRDGSCRQATPTHNTRPAISVAKRQNRKMPPFPAPSSQAASIIIIRQQNSATNPPLLPFLPSLYLNTHRER